ncbi:MAG: TolC family outer membrane protein [Pseudomonadota bacterium]
MNYRLWSRATPVQAVAALWVAFTASAQAETLRDAMAMAYQGNPTLEAQRAVLRGVDETVMQANANYLPNVAGTGSIDRTQTDVDVGPVTQGGVVVPGNQAIGFDATNKNIGARVDQPIFRGFRTKNSVSRAKADVLAQRANLVAVEQDTLLQTVTAYMSVLRDQAVLQLNDKQIAVLRRQLEASQDRFRVGEITRTDVAQSQARLADAISRRAAASAALTASQELYRRVVGELPAGLTEPDVPQLPMTLDEAVDTGMMEAPAVLAARFSEQSARKAVSEAKGGLMPTLNGFASVARASGVQLLGPDVTAQSTSVVKSIGAEVTIPLYQSGAEYSAVRQAKQLQSQRLLEIRAAERQVIEAVSTAWQEYQASVAQIKANQESVKANEIALEGVRQEAAVGSRTTLDVLDAEQETLNAQVNLIQAESTRMIAAYSLLSSIGELTAERQKLAVALYDPSKNLDQVKWKLFGFGGE